MNIINDEAAQTSAELILLFGGVIAIVIIAAFFYKNYLSSLGGNITANDLQTVTNNINGTNNSNSLINKLS
jgi:uncharacterized protein (UPF0333 family)